MRLGVGFKVSVGTVLALGGRGHSFQSHSAATRAVAHSAHGLRPPLSRTTLSGTTAAYRGAAEGAACRGASGRTGGWRGARDTSGERISYGASGGVDGGGLGHGDSRWLQR